MDPIQIEGWPDGWTLVEARPARNRFNNPFAEVIAQIERPDGQKSVSTFSKRTDLAAKTLVAWARELATFEEWVTASRGRIAFAKYMLEVEIIRAMAKREKSA